jgi:DNA-binding CsgD family transcriptional regulator
VLTALDRVDSPAVLLTGGPGVGKSRLLRTVTDTWRDRGGYVLACTGSESTVGIPFAAVSGVLPKIAGRATGVFDAVARHVRDSAAGRRVLIAVDDTADIDDASRALISYLVATTTHRLLMAARVDVAATLRLTRPAQWRRIERIIVAPLPRVAATALLNAVLGGPVDGVTAELLWRGTRGNPLFLRHVVEIGLETEALAPVADVWTWRGSLGVQPQLRDLVTAMVDMLDPDEGRALEYVAHAEPVPWDALAKLVEPSVLRDLERRGLLDVDHALVRVGHPLYGEAVRAGAGEQNLRRLFRELAEAVDECGHDDEERLRTVTWRVRAGVRVPSDQVVAAATDALARSDGPLAERLARQSDSPDGVLVLGQALVVQGKSDEAERLFALAGSRLEPQADAQRTAVRSLNLFWSLRRVDQARAVLDAWHQRHAPDLPVPADLRAAELAIAILGSVPVRTPIGPDDLTLVAETPLVASAAEPLRAYLWTYLGRPQQVVDGYADGSLSTVGTWPLMRGAAATCHANALAMAGQLDQSFEVARGYYDDAVERGDPAEVATLALQLGVCVMMTGRVRDAVPYLHEAHALMDEHLPFPLQVYILCEYGVLAAATDDPDTAALALADARQRLPQASSLGDHVAVADIRVLAHSGHLAVAAQRLREVVDRYLEADLLTNAAECLDLLNRLQPRPATAAQLHDVAARCDGELFPLMARYATALARADIEALRAIVPEFESRGYTSMAMESAAAALASATERRQLDRIDPLAQELERLLAACGGYRPPWTRQAHPLGALTWREREVCELAAAGVPNSSIAEQLGVSVRTVDNHLHRAYEKLGVRTTHELAAAINQQPPDVRDLT